ncbi:FAD-dependent oxidoreductase [Horticoccus luteus]|uniref:FAD-dependent oxidoreductase n=1 Tax=Horticoccus luteus TaxID=2862869 RepID=A0A8F9XKV9_9BACT|nr:FAD-dependent oxidoreductase [Horticoccus luteus]QYM78596.1 FAD-dependent oxidoreductase [Horticoccus luteus]
MNTTPYWIDTASLPRFPKLNMDLDVDAVVVGGGITGLTAAYLLKQAGKTVVVLERRRCASVDTGHTTAHLTSVTDKSLGELRHQFGSDHTRAVWDAGAAAIDQIVRNMRAEDIACDFRWVTGYWHGSLAEAAGDPERFEREAETARELGIAAEFRASVPFVARPGVAFAHQAIFHPRKYLAALARRIDGDGSRIFENTAVTEVQAEPLTVKADKFAVRCRYVVLATHTPLMGITGLTDALLFQTKLALYSSYALGAKLAPGTVPEAAFWDTTEPYYYVRVERKRGHDYVIFGGEDHKTGQGDEADAYARLEARLREFLPDAAVDHRWSGQVITTNDGLPFIGETAPRQFAATGFAGNGMTFGTLGGMMAADAMLGRKNPWQQLFSPERKHLVGGTWNYVAENKDYPFYMLRDWLARGDGTSLQELAREEGKILELDGRKVAAYRDAAGAVTMCSPVCTHLKCIVGWNAAEKTWDCPCHGSRFTPQGEVISGPAEEPLEKIENP